MAFTYKDIWNTRHIGALKSRIIARAAVREAE